MYGQTKSPVVVQVCGQTDVGVKTGFGIAVLAGVNVVFVKITDGNVVVKQVNALLFWCDTKGPGMSCSFELMRHGHSDIGDHSRTTVGS